MRGFPNRLFCGHLNPKKSILAKELHDLFARILQWGFRQTCDPKVGDMVIQHDPLTGRAFHVDSLTFYEFVPATKSVKEISL